MSEIYIVMGVSASGKSTIGKALAKKRWLPYFDADDYHPQANIEKMKNQQPLNDQDRQPWLERLAELLKSQEVKGAVLACSALKARYRQTLCSELKMLPTFIYLKADFAMMLQRIQARKDHFMPPELLQSQFRDLEEPDHAITVSVDQSVDDILSEIQRQLD